MTKYTVDLFRSISLTYSVIPRISVVLLINLIYSTFVYNTNSLNLTYNSTLLNTILAMLLAFRTNRAFDRYKLGASIWTSLSTSIKNLSRLIWNGVKASDNTEKLEKLECIKCLLAIAIAAKHSLQGKNAYQQSNVIDLLPSIKQPYTDKLNYIYSIINESSNRVVENAPFEIAQLVSLYIRNQRNKNNIQEQDIQSFNQTSNLVFESLSKFDLMFIGVPNSYNRHMKQLLVLYFVISPFQSGFSNFVLNIVLAVALFGLDAIATEIEEPFGNDFDDLPLDRLCRLLCDDLVYITDGFGDLLKI